MIRKFRLYNSRQDLFDLTGNKDFISVNPRGLGLGVTNEFHASGASFVTRKREIDAGELDLTLVIGYMQDNAYARYTEFVQFLNHSPYVLEYEFDGRTYRRDCILSELSKEELRISRTLQETLKLEFTSPFYIERTEQTQPYVPIEGKAGKIYETVTRKRQVFETVPESYREGDLWHCQDFDGLEIGGRNLLVGSKDYSGTWVNKEHWAVSSDTHKGTLIASRTGSWSGLGQILNVFKGEQYTFSAYVKSTSTIVRLYLLNRSNSAGLTPTLKTIKLEPDTWTYVICVVSVSSDGLMFPRFELDNNDETVYVSAMKLERGNVATDWSPAPEDLTGGNQSGYFIATKSNTSFDFNDFEFYNTTLDTQDKTYDYIYDYTYGPDLYVEPVETEFAYTYDYIYDDEEGEGNSFTIDNNSVYMGVADTSPCEITIYGPCVNPHWDIMQGTEVVQSDGYNLTIPEGYRLVVSSHPNRQRAQLIALDGTVSNVYQQQDLSKTNFVRFPVGRSKILFFNYDRVTFKYREEYVVI